MTEGKLIGFLAILSALTIGLSAFFGTTALPARTIIEAVFGGGDAATRVIVWEIRMPRALAAFCAGAALGASGAALQGLLRNPLAEPGVLGISAMAALGATATLYYGAGVLFAPALPLAAIGGALLGTALLAFVATRQSSVTTLILIGVGLASFAGALMSLLVNLSPNPFNLSDMMAWMLGSVANRSLQDLALALTFMIPGLIVLLAARRGLAVLALGEEAAAATGLAVNRQRLLIVIGTGLATGASVALAGAIGFVGIVAPHVVRPFVHHDPARTVLPSALLAGLFLVLADAVIRTLPTAVELKLGVAAGLVGAPLFVWIASRRGDAS